MGKNTKDHGPSALLDDIREAASEPHRDSGRLAGLIQALDEHLRRGGELPQDWGTR